VSSLESQKAEAEKSVVALKESEEKSKRRIRGLASQVSELQKVAAEKDEMIASREKEISSLQSSQAALKDSLNQQISTLNDEKKALSDETQETISAKNRFVTILAVLLAIAVIVAIFEFVRLRKRALPS
jgi:chromosome segregation ATPase